eukprot:2606754-Pleurochrysis_carterae.AAC.5
MDSNYSLHTKTSNCHRLTNPDPDVTLFSRCLCRWKCAFKVVTETCFSTELETRQLNVIDFTPTAVYACAHMAARARCWQRSRKSQGSSETARPTTRLGPQILPRELQARKRAVKGA